MADGITPFRALQGAQALASAPDAHVWLSASAGTGKTHVLTARVFRMLLRGVYPENILCLTFTRAGAAEMADRIHERLAAWVQMDDGALFKELEALGEPSGPDAREHARRLFARVLEATGGGLRIQTIHSFCQQLLAGFPLEAGLVPGFRALEDREQQELARQALADMVLEAEEQGDETLIGALQAMALRMSEDHAEAYLRRCGPALDVLEALGPDIRSALFDHFGLPTGDIATELAARCAVFDVVTLSRLARVNEQWGGKKGTTRVEAMRGWMAMDPADRAAHLPLLRSALVTKDAKLLSQTDKFFAIEPDYDVMAQPLADACLALLALRDQAAWAELAAQALYAGRAFARAYTQAKRDAGAVDYDDLIVHASDLLYQPGVAEWISYKLDQRTDHILVDEAQDTNSRQWQIVRALTSEFFAGEGAKGDKNRSLFVVGDFKQAIFGFQGTSPMAFAGARELFRQLAGMVEQPFHELSLDRSFRSTPAVLEVVDATIATLDPTALGLIDPDAIHHESANLYPGEVRLWKPIAAPDRAEDGEEAEDEEGEIARDQERILAEKIAKEIRDWIDSGLMLESKGRPVQPGDIMILLRSRGDLARLIVARLYEAGVEVAGIDRLRLQAPLAVLDLMAALRFAAQPEDDLNLASLLVSPLIGWTHEELEARALPRRGTLWQHVRAQKGLPGIDRLDDMLAQADFISPYRLLEYMLSGPMQGRRRLLARLGEEARDPIDELLQAALNFEQQDHPALQPFLDWFDREEGDIKRESDSNLNAVRLLTVHGAKGLQAPIVILADAAANPDRAGGVKQLDYPLEPGTSIPLLSPRKTERCDTVTEATEGAQVAERQEHWRLLYVAMTRAEEKLFITGSLGVRAKGVAPVDSWFAAVERAMAHMGAAWEDNARWQGSIGWHGSETLLKKPLQKKEEFPSVFIERPAWISQPAPVEARPPRPLAPTAPREDDTAQPPPGPAMRAAAHRGKCLHALFERLPAVAPAERRAAADRWLEHSAGVGDAAVRTDLIDHALAIIDNPLFQDIFSPDALAEAPIAAVVGADVVAGTVDRLLVTDTHIRLVDFKTGRHVPDAANVPDAYLRQMAAYVAALEVIFPGRAIEAALLYTAGPAMIPLDAVRLAPFKPGLTA